MQKLYLIVLFLLYWTFVLANPQDNFQKANDAYQKNDYATATKLYEMVLQDGFISKELYYNLGNCYYKVKQLSKARLNFERALLLAPADSDIQHNLKILRQDLVDEIEEIPPFFLKKWWLSTSRLLGSTVWSILALLTMWLGIAGLVFWLIGKTRQQRKRAFLGGLVLLALSLLCYALGNTRVALEQDSGQAVIMPKEIALRSAPDGDSKIILQLHEGTKVSTEDQLQEWYKVRLANGEVGWLPMHTVERI